MSTKSMAEVILRSTLLDLQDSLFLAKELEAAGFGLVADAKGEALEDAADALEMQPPKLRATYVATLRLYGAEPWRPTTCPSECAATNHPGAEHGVAK